MVVAADGAVLLLVSGLGDAGGCCGAGDIGDRRDVVPVDAVADAEGETGSQDTQARGRRGGGEQDVEQNGKPLSRNG
jgi:hypothetical protein